MLKPNNKAEKEESYINLGIVRQKSSDFHIAIEYYEHHLLTAKELGDKAREGWTYGNLGNAYYNSSNFQKAIQYHERHLEIAKEVQDKVGEGRAYRNLGNASQGLRDFNKAIEFYESYLEIAKKAGDKAGERWAYGTLGIAYHNLGDFQKAIQYHERHLEIAKQVGDKDEKRRAYGNLGIAYQKLGDFHKAIENHECHLEIAKEVQDKAREGRAYGNLGNAYQGLRDFNKAIEYYERHLEIAKEVGDKDEEGQAYGNLGFSYHDLGDFHSAIRYHERRLEIAKEVQDKAGEGRAYGNLGNASPGLRDFNKAIEFYESYLEIAKEAGNKAGERWAYGTLGIAYHNLGDFQKAIQYHERHLEIAKQVGDKDEEGQAYENLGLSYHDLGDFHRAIEYHERHLEIAKEVQDKVGEGRAYGNLDNASQGLRDFNKAIEYHERHIEIAKEVGDKDEEGQAYGNLGLSYHDVGDVHKAIDYYERHLAGEGRVYGNLGNACDSLGDFHKATEHQERHLKIVKEVGNNAEEGGAYAIEEDEVPYYTGRKKLADKKDATVDYEENKKTLIKRGKLGGEEDTWHLREAGASIKLNSGAVQQPVPFTYTCLLWNPRTLSPPIASDDILVSSVIELSHDGPPDLEYSFTVALLHSAPNLEGYEVVIKQLTDQENNEWKELKTENTWHGSETSTVPGWLFPFAQAVCSKSGVSSFAAIWRPKSFTFSRGTAVGPELTCIVPDFPDVSVQIPQSCVPVNQDFCVTIQVQEFPSSKLKGEEGLVGPVLHISGTQNVTLIAPVTIRIPLTLCKGKQELAELCPGELRILHCESLVEPHDWKDITDGLDEPPLLLDGKVQFKVRHFSRFRPVKLRTSRLKSASDFNAFVRKIRRRSRPQYAGFFTCLCETSVPGHFGLRLFCYPQKLQHDVNQKISRCIVPYIGEGTSLRPVCEEEKIFVSLSETIIPQGSDEKNALQFVRFRGNEVYDTGGEVCLGSVSVPKVKFNNQSQELLCNVTMVLASQVPVPFDHEEGTHILRDIYVVKDGEPSDCELEYLSKELGVKWKELGRRLKFNQATLASFDKANEELSEKSFQMLTAWKQKEGCEATYKVLYNALCHELVECKRLAEQFCCRKRS